MTKKVTEALQNWHKLNAQVQKLSVKELEEALKIEQKRKPPRKTFLKRIHQRLTALRATIERKKLMKGIK